MPSWDISEKLSVPLKVFLDWVGTHPVAYPAMTESDEPRKRGRRGPYTPKQAKPPKSEIEKRVRGEPLPSRAPRPKPETLEQLLAELDITLISDSLGLEEGDAKQAITRLYDGDIQRRVAQTYDLKYWYVRMLTDHLGWRTDWRRPGIITDFMVGKLTVEQVKVRFNAGDTLEAIGAAAGVTRERIRQVAQREGLVPRAVVREQRAVQRARDKALAKQEERRLRRERSNVLKQLSDERLAHLLQHANELWRQGLSHSAIAAAYNMKPNSMSWYIDRARKKLGATWFPRRSDPETRKPLWGPLSERTWITRDKLGEFMTEARRRWGIGESVMQIAAAYNLPWKRIAAYIKRARGMLGEDWFPRRRPDLVAIHQLE